MLDSHPDVSMAYYTQFLVDLLEHAERYELDGGLDSARLSADLVSRDPHTWNFSADYFAELWRGGVPATLGAALRQLFGDYSSRRGTARFGIKENRLLYHAVSFAERVPESRFLHVIRDGRDVAMSYLSVYWGPQIWHEAAVLWKERVETARTAGRALGPDRYREVSYERLVDDPSATLREVCEFCELSFDESMLEYHTRQDQLFVELVDQPIHHNLRNPPARLRDWSSEMPPRGVSEFEEVAGYLLEDLGYKPSRATNPIS